MPGESWERTWQWDGRLGLSAASRAPSSMALPFFLSLTWKSRGTTKRPHVLSMSVLILFFPKLLGETNHRDNQTRTFYHFGDFLTFFSCLIHQKLLITTGCVWSHCCFICWIFAEYKLWPRSCLLRNNPKRIQWWTQMIFAKTTKKSIHKTEKKTTKSVSVVRWIGQIQLISIFWTDLMKKNGRWKTSYPSPRRDSISPVPRIPLPHPRLGVRCDNQYIRPTRVELSDHFEVTRRFRFRMI